MRERLLVLLKKKAFCKKRVRLASGKISNFYIDVRRVSLSSEGVHLISGLIWNLIKNDNISALGGPTLGADPIVGGVCFLAHKNKKQLKGFLIRKNPKKHGRRKMIEGPDLFPGERVIVVDDVATSGASLIEAIKVLRKAKIKVEKAIAVVDRQEGAAENFSKMGCPFISLFTKADFISPDRK